MNSNWRIELSGPGLLTMKCRKIKLKKRIEINKVYQLVTFLYNLRWYYCTFPILKVQMRDLQYSPYTLVEFTFCIEAVALDNVLQSKRWKWQINCSPHPSSSLPSVQSFLSSHTVDCRTHSPSLQRNCMDEHVSKSKWEGHILRCIIMYCLNAILWVEAIRPKMNNKKSKTRS